MMPLKTGVLHPSVHAHQSAVPDKVRSAGLIKFTTGSLVFVMMLALALYMIRGIGFIPEGLPSLLFALPFCVLPALYAFSGLIELISGAPLIELPQRWYTFSHAQRRSLTVIIALLFMAGVHIMMSGLVPPYMYLFQ